MLDNAVKVAKEFASRRNDTLVVVVADHAHPVSIVGTYDDDDRTMSCATSSASTSIPRRRTTRRRTPTAIRIV
jgi:alkaline phosphatase